MGSVATVEEQDHDWIWLDRLWKSFVESEYANQKELYT